jgi:maleylacetate reductase
VSGWDGRSFVVPPLPTRVVAGPGSRRDAGAELARAGIHRVLVLSTPRGRAAADEIAAGAVATFDGARRHVPVEAVAAAEEAVRRARPDGCLAVGGGSTIGLAKALALRAGLPYVAVPTTLAGSEMTPIWGLTEDGRKTTGRDERVRPVTAVYDAELLASLPVPTAVTSGLNALAHAVEALYAPDGSPLVDLLATEGAAAVTGALRGLVAFERGDGRATAQYGAWLCGICLGATTMSLHHKLCHLLGGRYDLPHAETHATVLPHVMALLLPAADRADRLLAGALGDDRPERVVWELGRSAGDLSLRALGLPAGALGEVRDLVRREVTGSVPAADLDGLLRAAYHGAPPRRTVT